MTYGLPLLAAAALACTAMPTTADAARSADRHVHGTADLVLAREGQRLTARFESPVFNLLGIEHAPQTPAQREAWQTVLTRLTSKEDPVLVPNRSARCALVGVSLSDPFADDAEHDEHDAEHEAHDEHAHDGEHEHESHEEHDGEHEHESHDEHDGEHEHEHESHDDHAGDDTDHGHTDLDVEYEFNCAQGDRLQEVEVRLFREFPGLERIDAIYIDNRKQVGATLGASSER
ncbi:MAG: DUF2796 domain-containing protein, partial [Pseudomonadota bacterium]